MTTIDVDELLESLYPLNFGKRFMFQKYCNSLLSQNKIEEKDVEDYLTKEFLYDKYMDQYLKNDVKFIDLVGLPKENKQIYEKFLNGFQNKILEVEERYDNFKNDIREMGLKAILMGVACTIINDVINFYI